MSKNVIQNLKSRAQAAKKTIALPEGHDLRVLKAASIAQRENLANIVLVGDEKSIRQQALENQLDLTNIVLVNPCTSERLNTYVSDALTTRGFRNQSDEEAKNQLADPLIFANMMLRRGEVDGCISGAVYSSNDVIKQALYIIGKNKANLIVSSFFLILMDQPHHPFQGPLIFTDCGMNIYPNEQKLAEIAITSAESLKSLLDISPRIAMLSFSTNQSAEHALVDRVRTATDLVRNARPELAVIGDVQFDAALIPSILTRKMPDAAFQEPANVFVFPNLEAANIGYKIANRIGGAKAIGPILQGLNKPANDLSRGCSTDDIVNAIVVTALQASSNGSLDNN